MRSITHQYTIVNGYCEKNTDCGFCKICTTNTGQCANAAAGSDPKSQCGGLGCNGSGACNVAPADLTCAPCATCQTCNKLTGKCENVNDLLFSPCSSATVTSGVCKAGTCWCDQDGDCGICKTCNLANGQCVNAAAATDPKNQCFGQGCNGFGACKIGCPTCAICQTCNVFTGKCETATDASLTSCTANGITGGVCKSSRCWCDKNAACGLCKTCTLATGQCANAVLGSDPKLECAGLGCNGIGGCKLPCPTCGTCQACNYLTGKCENVADGSSTACSTTDITGGVCKSGTCWCNVNTNCGLCKTCDTKTGQCINAAADTDPKNQCGGVKCNGFGACYLTCPACSICQACNRLTGQCVTTGTKAQATATVTAGHVSSIAVTNGGSGYASAPTINIGDPVRVVAQLSVTVAAGIPTPSISPASNGPYTGPVVLATALTGGSCVAASCTGAPTTIVGVASGNLCLLSDFNALSPAAVAVSPTTGAASIGTWPSTWKCEPTPPLITLTTATLQTPLKAIATASISGAGVVTSIVIVNPGTGYVTGNPPTITITNPCK